MSNIRSSLWGVLLIILGVIFGLNALEITNINIFFDGWWCFFIIIPCCIDLLKEGEKTGNVVGILVGLALFLACRDLIDFVLIWKLAIPVALVLIGLSIIFKDTINKNVKNEIKKMKQNKDKEYYATFGEQNLNFDKEEFTGCDLNAIFGGVKCDLREAEFKDDVLITASAIFGGITIYVPEDVNVKINSTPIFGGTSDERRKKTKDGKHTLYIKSTCMFGGVDIK